MAYNIIIMKKILLIIVCVMAGIISASSTPMEIKKRYKNSSYVIDITISGNFDKGELLTGPVNIQFKKTATEENYLPLPLPLPIKTKVGDSESINMVGNYDAISSKFTGTFELDNCPLFICCATLSNNEEKDKVLVKNIKKDKWLFYIEKLCLHKFENKDEIENVRIIVEEGLSFSLNDMFGMFRHVLISPNFEVAFKNGNKLIGPYTRQFDISAEGVYDYIWSNGDKYTGVISYKPNLTDYNQIIPVRGGFTLTTGETISNSSILFERYKQTVLEDRSLVNSTPMEIFEIVQKQIEAERLKKQREKEAAELKEKLARQQREYEKQQQEQEKRHNLIRKYGYKYGQAIYDRDPQVGMTIEMIQTMHNGKGKMRRYVRFGKEITILSYGGESIFLLGVFGKEDEYEYTFVDGRLVEFSLNEGGVNSLIL